MVPNVDVDNCNDDEMNAQSDSSIQAETSKMTPKELRICMLRSTDNFGEVLHSETVPPKPVKVTWMVQGKHYVVNMTKQK